MADQEINLPDRMLSSLYKIVRQFFPKYDFLGVYSYRVVTLSGDRVNLQIIKKNTNLPDILSIDMHPGVAGMYAELTLGSSVLVSFIDGDPAYPIITHFEKKGANGFLPVGMYIDATALVKIGEEAASIQLGGLDQQTIARYPAIATWAAQVNAYIIALNAILAATVLKTPPGTAVTSVSLSVTPVSPLSPTAASAKVTSQ